MSGSSSGSRPSIRAVAELIWNAVDGDTTRIDVFLDEDAVGVGINAARIVDNGHGIDRDVVEKCSGSLGTDGACAVRRAKGAS